MQLNVSRSALREALRVLTELAILDVKHGKGTYVLEPQLRPLTDLSIVEDSAKLAFMKQAIEARAAIEIEVVRLAALRADAENINGLEAYYAESISEPLQSKRRYDYALAFEKLIGEASKNPYLVSLQNQAHKFFSEAWRTGGFIPRSADQRNVQHARILQAIASHNADLAVELMKIHMHISF